MQATRKTKWIFGIILVAFLSIIATSAAFAQSPPNVTIDGQRVVFPNQQPATVDGRTFVPVRGVFEDLGFDVDWNAQTRTVTLERAGYEVILTVGRATFTINGAVEHLEAPAQIIGGSTMIPLRAVLEGIGYGVDWDAGTRTVLVSRPDVQQHVADDAPIWLAHADADSLEFGFVYVSLHEIEIAPFIVLDYEVHTSQIIIPCCRRQTESERNAWIAEYWAMGGMSAFEEEVIRLTNIERANHGLSELQIDYVFMMAARFYAQTLANNDLPLGHWEGPYGGSAGTVLSFGATSAGWRNGGAGHRTPEHLVQRWMESEGHRNNILRDGHTRIGTGTHLGGTRFGVFHYMVLAGGDVQMAEPPPPTPPPTVPLPPGGGPAILQEHEREIVRISGLPHLDLVLPDLYARPLAVPGGNRVISFAGLPDPELEAILRTMIGTGTLLAIDVSVTHDAATGLFTAHVQLYRLPDPVNPWYEIWESQPGEYIPPEPPPPILRPGAGGGDNISPQPEQPGINPPDGGANLPFERPDN